MLPIQFRYAVKEQSIAGHRVIDASARENQSVVTAKCRNHDRHRHDHRALRAKDSLHRRARHSPLIGLLNSGERQRHDVSDIRQQIQTDNYTTTNQKRQRQVTSRVLDLTSSERDVVPGWLREQRAGHRASEDDCQSQAPSQGQAWLRLLRSTTIRPGTPPRWSVSGARMIPAKQQSNDYQSNQCCRLSKRESVLN